MAKGVMDYVLKFPYIKQHKEPKLCAGWETYEGRKRKCTKAAYFYYKAGKTTKAHAKSGTYCWVHLVERGIRATKYDEQRAERAFKKIKQEEATARS